RVDVELELRDHGVAELRSPPEFTPIRWPAGSPPYQVLAFGRAFGRSNHLALFEDGIGEFWDRTQPEPVLRKLRLPVGVSCAAISEGGEIVVGCEDGSVHLWEWGAWQTEWRPIAHHPAPVTAVEMSRSSLLVSADAAGGVRFLSRPGFEPRGA